jgi:gluconate 2-dehydrogenase alpha chain
MSRLVATGVTFVDTEGNEWEQPADLVILSAYTIFNVQILLLSKPASPHDPLVNSGVVGRNFTHQTISDVTSFSIPKIPSTAWIPKQRWGRLRTAAASRQ